MMGYALFSQTQKMVQLKKLEKLHKGNARFYIAECDKASLQGPRSTCTLSNAASSDILSARGNLVAKKQKNNLSKRTCAVYTFQKNTQQIWVSKKTFYRVLECHRSDLIQRFFAATKNENT